MAALDDPLLRFRDRFPILATSTYLVSNSLGAMPSAAREALLEYADAWATRGVRAWEEGWWTMSSDVGDVLAPLLGAAPGTIVMLPNVTTASAVALSSFAFAPPRDRVVMIEGDFPSVRYVYDGLARRLGADVLVVPEQGLGVDLDRLLAAIDEQTAIVAVSHALFRTAFLLDAEAVARRCREVGAVLVLDVFHSAGIVPIELARWGVGIAVGGVLKWLCGGPGGAFLYVAPELRGALRPALTGWMAHADPFAFEPPPMRPRDDALRFALGTPAVPALYAAREGPRILAEAGVAAIRAKSTRQTERVIAAAQARGFPIRTPLSAERRGGTVSVAVPDAERVAAELGRRGILCDARPEVGLRIAPHFYTRDDEIDRTFAAIDEILAP